MTKLVHKDLGNPHYVAWRKFLVECEEWNAERIREYQFEQLKKILSLAYTKSKGYKRLFKSVGFEPEDLKCIEDIQKLPFTTKEGFRDCLEEFVTRKRGTDYITTGGSTGIPFGFYRNREAFAKELASKAHQYSRIGWKEGDRQMVFRGLPIKTKTSMQFFGQYQELRCSSYHLSPEIMMGFVKRAFKYQPEWIKCYPSSGSLFARFLKENKVAFPKIKGVLCASENLYDFQKELLREVFQCRIFSHYGHYELAAIAGFCEHEDLYHVLPQYGYAELIDSEGNIISEPGKVGEIVGTSFIMEATPFIRYRTRDFAVLKGYKCESCGRPYQIWDRIEGRLQEFMVTSNGRLIAMTAINMHDDIFDHMKQFQFYQKEKGRAEFRYIPRESCTSQIVDDVKKRLLVKFGNDFELTMKPVEDIPATKRGKHRFLIQEMNLGVGD